MADVFTPEKRSAVMRAVKSRDTSPELAVRRCAHAMGLRYRLNRRDIPGAPDLLFPSRRIALYVHGCFWHGHDCPRGSRMPATNQDYWRAKIDRNMARDKQVAADLAAAGWRHVLIWECETKPPERLAQILGQRLTRAPAALRNS